MLKFVYTNVYKLLDMVAPNKPSANDKEMVRVSVSEAARLFGVNTQTVRRAIQSQEVTYVVVAGRYKINFESLVRWSQRHTTVRNKLIKKGIGQYVDKWKIKNPLYSPNPKSITKKPEMPIVVTPPSPTRGEE
ncbi:MAG: DNA-binding protein [Candidatus Magasanikbacteria bacterium]|nr:DNA-binding protein [Candidatus Magasanikbacteria bacterium]